MEQLLHVTVWGQVRTIMLAEIAQSFIFGAHYYIIIIRRTMVCISHYYIIYSKNEAVLCMLQPCKGVATLLQACTTL